jgi:hypothetical protein
MIDWISKKRRDKKTKEVHEQKLMRSLAEKVSRYEKPSSEPIDDFTEIFLGGKKRRVAKEQITITDDLSGSFTRP